MNIQSVLKHLPLLGGTQIGDLPRPPAPPESITLDHASIDSVEGPLLRNVATCNAKSDLIAARIGTALVTEKVSGGIAVAGAVLSLFNPIGSTVMLAGVGGYLGVGVIRGVLQNRLRACRDQAVAQQSQCQVLETFQQKQPANGPLTLPYSTVASSARLAERGGNDESARQPYVDLAWRVVGANPATAEPILAGIDHMLGDVGKNSAADTRDAVGRILDARPAVGADFLESAARYVNESNSRAGRQLKLDGLADIVAKAPDFSAAHLDVISSVVAQSESLTGREAKIKGFDRLLAAHPGIDVPTLSAVGDFVLDSNSEQGYTMKFDAVQRLMAAKPDAGVAEIQLMHALVEPSTSLEGKDAKLQGMTALWTAHPKLSPEVARVVVDFANESNSAEAYRMKFDGVGRILALNPDVDASTMQAVSSYVDRSEGLDGRTTRMNATVKFFELNPKLDAAFLESLP